MRLRLTFRCSHQKPLVLPIDYHSLLQGFIYKALEDEHFATFLHDEGYTHDNRSFKLFTFSRLYGKYTIHKQKKQIIFTDEVVLYISSILPSFIQLLGQTLTTSSSLHLHHQRITTESLEYEKVEIKDNVCVIKMLSPITVHSTFVNHQQKKITQYYDPEDAAFSHLVSTNIMKKYAAYYNEEAAGTLHIKPIHVTKRDKVITRFRGFIIAAWNGTYELEGDAALIQFAHAVGLGSRNAQGFGMFEKIST
ncbi:CRISPR-associated endoribonuclease Cas6 [Longirhabdus pacifica]|uniref:CRISPR-associated endoribonuclease Cas6 n=1 Tax=Longirhabdus pacifica TaxID=2305227 RepID=UPI001008890B|nr:CRISPR-associated endoribonuclease Cas6 [Longirhabdus pacifica]